MRRVDIRKVRRLPGAPITRESGYLYFEAFEPAVRPISRPWRGGPVASVFYKVRGRSVLYWLRAILNCTAAVEVWHCPDNAPGGQS